MHLVVLMVFLSGMIGCSQKQSLKNDEMTEKPVDMIVLKEIDEPTPLTEEDWSVAGVYPGADSSAVRLALGKPASIISHESPYGEELVRWEYDEITINFNEPRTASSISILGPTFMTHRGITVGDSLSKVEEMYGPPNDKNEIRWLYCDPMYEECVNLIQFRITSHKVNEIYLGIPPH